MEVKIKNTKKSFFLTVIVVWLLCVLALGTFVISWATPISWALFIILSIFLYSFSVAFTKKLFSIFLKPFKLYKLRCGLVTNPKVAIVYTTMNDVLPECLSIVKQTYPCDVFVLDDSSLPEKRRIVDKITNEKNFTVMRRKQRKGFKAGAINNWINVYGKNYDYFVLLDSDSFIPKDWVEKTLEYAENPLNSKVAIFQGLINLWNLDNKFIRTLAGLRSLGQDIWEVKLGNYLDAVFCYGHNCMIRMKPVLEIGGFVEGYVSEDFATAVKLAENGYKSRFVPLHTYEAQPENIRGFIKRQYKWTRGSMEFLSMIKNSTISLGQKALLFLIPLGHFSYIGILFAMLLTIFGYMTSVGQFYGFLQNLINYHIFFIWSIPIFRYAIVLQIISLILNFVRFKQLGIKISQFLKHDLLSKAIGAIMLPYEVLSIIKYAINRKLQFPVTPKQEKKLNFKDIVLISKITVFFSLLFVLGVLFVNPLGLIFNIGWLIPFIFAPLILYIFSNDKLPKSYLIYSDGGTYDDAEINSKTSQSKDVYSFIRKVKFSKALDFNFIPQIYKRKILVVLFISFAALLGISLYSAVAGFLIYQPPISMPPTIGGVCGNGICEIGENSTTCPQDCPEVVEIPITIEGGLQLISPTVKGPRSDPKEIYIGDTVKLFVHVEKLGDANISKVWAIVKSPSGALETVEFSSNGVWSASIEVKEAGIYVVTFNTVDETDTYANPVTIVFNVMLLPIPILLGGGGGGFAPSAGVPPSAY